MGERGDDKAEGGRSERGDVKTEGGRSERGDDKAEGGGSVRGDVKTEGGGAVGQAPDGRRRPNRWGDVMGLEMLELTPSAANARIVIDERHHQPYGIMHGGVYCSIVEDVASQAAGTAARARGDRGVVGVSNSTDFLRSHSSGELRAAAEPLHIGRSAMLWEVRITRAADGALVARGQVRFHVLDELPGERERATKGSTS